MSVVFGSLRVIFGLTAAAGLLVVAIMTGLVIHTSRTNQNVVAAVLAGQARMEVMLRLQYALDHYQSASSIRLQGPSPSVIADLERAREGFIHALDEVRTLPLTHSRHMPMGEEIFSKGLAAAAVFERNQIIHAQVDQMWQTEGHRTALNEVRRIYADYFELKDIIRNHILYEDRLLEETVTGAARFQQMTAPIALSCLALALLSYGAILALVWARLNPGLHRLEAGVRAFGAGRMDHRIDVKGRDELARLAGAFNSMAQQLAEEQQALQEFVARQEATIAARTQELEQANRALAATDERRRAFFADISHELRTPLTVIRGEAQIALRADDDTVDAMAVLERILSQTRDLSRLVDDLFLIARAEAGGLTLHLQTIDVATLARQLTRDFGAIAREAGGCVTFSGETPVRSIADPDRLRQILMAVLDNALRHTPRPATITLATWRDGPWAMLRVSDDGPGFAPENMHDMFTRFRRGKSGGEGAGIGLAVVRALAEAQGGQAELENRTGGGACVTIRLPAPGTQQTGTRADALIIAG